MKILYLLREINPIKRKDSTYQVIYIYIHKFHEFQWNVIPRILKVSVLYQKFDKKRHKLMPVHSLLLDTILREISGENEQFLWQEIYTTSR